MMKTGWVIALLWAAAAPAWAQQVVEDTRPIVGQHEEMLWRECQKESVRPQPTATAPKGGACDQLVESQARRNYVEMRYNGGMGKMCMHDARGNVLSCF